LLFASNAVLTLARHKAVTETRIIWRELLRKHRTRLLRYLRETGHRTTGLANLAGKLSTFLISSIETPQQAAAFWATVPAVLKRCDDPETYRLEMAAEAYAWAHLLDRYIRTWIALERMVERLCLPLAIHGVNVLDVGTGPGPSTLAITDFYHGLTQYAIVAGESRLEQPTSITAVEVSWENNAFRSRFREATLTASTETFSFDDICAIDPRRMRGRAREDLLDEEGYNPDTGFYEPVVWPETADLESQGLYRYRLITMSNFLTNPEILERVRSSLLAIFSDLQPGAVVLNPGGIGRHYPHIYQQLDEIAIQSGLQRKIDSLRVGSTPEDNEIIIHSTRVVAQHILSLCQMTDDVPKVVRVALDRGKRWGRHSAMRVYRRNRRRVAVSGE
jgi:hypothetical protein